MIRHRDLSALNLRQKMRRQSIQFGGNAKLKIYGTLKCKSGKRMKRETRVFFASKEDAIENGYRPCGNCLREEYKIWTSLAG